MIYNEKYFSPNFGYPKGSKGRNGNKVIGVGVHISGAEWQSNYNWITNPTANASYNTIIQRDGSIIQLVPEENAAYSHGKINSPTWSLLKYGINPNLYTLSVARVGSNQNLWDKPQMVSMVKLILYWADKYKFAPKYPSVFGHKHIDSIGRWYCPGDPFLNELYKQLDTAVKPQPSDPWIVHPIPKITRSVGVELDGKRTNEVAYLINNATYVKASFVAPLQPSDVVGAGDHIKISTRG